MKSLTKSVRRLLSAVLAAVSLAAALSLTGCGSAGTGEQPAGEGSTAKESGSASGKPVRIGYVNPTTGALAGNGEGCEWVVNQITEYVKEHPITVDGEQRNIEVIVYDSASDQNTCSEMAQKLIEEDAAWVPMYAELHMWALGDRVAAFIPQWAGWSDFYAADVTLK